MIRQTFDEWALELARLVAKRSTCYRRAVGAVLVNVRHHIIATGYNGRPSKMPHCNEFITGQGHPHWCAGANLPSGTGLDACEAIHAEQNALLQCKDVYDIATCYTTTSPCVTCTKLLLNTSCQRIVFNNPYSQPDAFRLWSQAGREWVHIPL